MTIQKYIQKNIIESDSPVIVDSINDKIWVSRQYKPNKIKIFTSSFKDIRTEYYIMSSNRNVDFMRKGAHRYLVL